MLNFILIIPQNLRAEVTQPDVIVLNKGQVSPYSGLLFSESKEKIIRIQLLTADACMKDNISLEKELDLYKHNSGLKDSQLDLALKLNTNLLTEYNKTVSTDNTMKIVYFGLGILTTGLAIYSAHQILK